MPARTLVDANDLLRRSRQFLRDPPCREPPSGCSFGDAPVRSSTRDHSGTELGSPSHDPSGPRPGASHGQRRACVSARRSPRGAASGGKGWESHVSFYRVASPRRWCRAERAVPSLRPRLPGSFRLWGAQPTPELLLRPPSGVRNRGVATGVSLREFQHCSRRYPSGARRRAGTVLPFWGCLSGSYGDLLRGLSWLPPGSPSSPSGVRGPWSVHGRLREFTSTSGSPQSPSGVRGHPTGIRNRRENPRSAFRGAASGLRLERPGVVNIQQAREPIRCSFLPVATPADAGVTVKVPVRSEVKRKGSGGVSRPCRSGHCALSAAGLRTQPWEVSVRQPPSTWSSCRLRKRWLLPSRPLGVCKGTSRWLWERQCGYVPTRRRRRRRNPKIHVRSRLRTRGNGQSSHVVSVRESKDMGGRRR